jgi:hypothetical protein
MNDSPRRISEFLPEVLQTDVLTKFFAATGDQLFQPDKVEYLSAFVGEKPSYYDPARDVYVQEINKDRQVYQLSPTAISRDSANNEVTHTLFYDDLINKLRFTVGVFPWMLTNLSIIKVTFGCLMVLLRSAYWAHSTVLMT